MSIINRQAHRWVAGLCLLGCWLGASVFAQEPLLPNLINVIVCDTGYTIFGYDIVPLGDINGDHLNDFLTGDSRGAYIYLGGSPLSLNWTLSMASMGPAGSGLGDVNGDLYSDFTTRSVGASYRKLNLFLGGPSLDAVPDFWFGHDTLYGIRNTVFTKDINQNGSPELISQNWDQLNLVLFELTDPIDSIPDNRIHPANKVDTGSSYEYSVFGAGLITGDLNGDGIQDLASNYRPRWDLDLRGEIWVYWGGQEFDTIPDLIIKRPITGPYIASHHYFGTTLVSLGDFNSDGFDDFFAGTSSGSADEFGFVFFGGPDIDTIPDLILPVYATKASVAPDINGDGYNDLITSAPSSLSTQGYINIYYGGPDVDSIPDLFIHNDDLEFFQTEFGMDVAGLGDINGDGINDWAFSLVDRMERGNIYLMSGTGPPTDVGIESEPGLPESIVLKQNYPNPFNPSTTIGFTLAAPSYVTITIYNVTGQSVRQLVTSTYPIGDYRVVWDGRDENGNLLSSGIYLYRLSTKDFSETRKMILLK